MNFLGHTYFVDRAVALDVEESPMIVAFEALRRPVVDIVKGWLLSPIRLVSLEFLYRYFSSLASIGKPSNK